MDSYLELVRRARRQDASAFARLYEEIYKDLYKFALYTLKNPHDAEDVVSDTVMDAYAGIKGLKKEESFRAWIFRILSNKCRRKLKEYVNKTTEFPGELGSGGQDFVEDSMVRAAFARLSDEERMIIALHLFGGYKSREIGEILHMHDGTVRSKESRALKKMAGMVGG